MLRYSYLPSDYHPMLLVLGTPQDLGVLAQWLRRMAETGADNSLSSIPSIEPSDTDVTLTFRDKALAFADRLENLCANGRRSGSEVLACDVIGEIPVKVSHGEFTDDFLVTLMP
jgi:hypothetical protein